MRRRSRRQLRRGTSRLARATPPEPDHQQGVDLDPVPEVLQAEVLVGGVLVVVVVDHRHDEERRLEDLGEEVDGRLPPRVGVSIAGWPVASPAIAATARDTGSSIEVHAAG